MRNEIFIIGAGGHAVSVAECVIAAGHRLLAFIDEKSSPENLLGFEVLRELPQSIVSPQIVLGIGDNNSRQLVSRSYQSKFRNAGFPNIIHPSASVSSFSNLTKGIVILQNAAIGSNSVLKDFSIVNTAASLDHDSYLGDYASMGPHSHTGGNVRIGKGSAIGIGATILHGINIGDNIVVGGKSYVNKNLDSNGLYFGTPAKYIRPRKLGDKYL